MGFGLLCHSNQPALELHPEVLWLIVFTVDIAPPASVLNAYLRFDASTRPRVICAGFVRRCMAAPAWRGCYCHNSQARVPTMTSPSRTPKATSMIPNHIIRFKAMESIRSHPIREL